MTNQQKSVPLREELPVEATWRLEDIFSSDNEWEKAFQQLKENYPEMKAYQGKLGESPEQLYQALQLQDRLSEQLGKLYAYARMRNDQDKANSTYQAMNDRNVSLLTQVSSTFSFIVPELLQIPEAKLSEMIQAYEPLQVYAQAIDDINRSRPHVLSASEEALLAQASEALNASSNTFSMLTNADITFPDITDENGESITISEGRYLRFMQSSDRRVREDAFKALFGTYGAFKNTIASTLGGNLKKDNYLATVHNYSSAREAALHENHIPETVYDQLVETVSDHLHLLHRYIELRKKLLQVDELHMYDLYVPLIQDVDMTINYEQAKDMVLKGLQPLGESYQRIVQEAYDHRWIDVYENKGKRSGAYSSGAYGTNPYILLNWQDNVNDMFTLAHELGHSVHSYLTRQHQPYRYGNYSIFVAEVASTCNEALLNDYLLKTTEDKKQRLYLLNHFLEGFRGTVFRQTMFAEFDHLIHETLRNGEALTAERLTADYYALNEKYFGNGLTIDEEIGVEWARIPHFYMGYYVYQYATGYSAATALAKQILEEGEQAVERYFTFLKAGSSAYPIDVLKKAGVDMTTATPVQEALSVFEARLNEFEALVEEILT
ncbi:oligoendopeptidase F [Bacillaceae bacterium SIJ1]|uniref:oligoendopeptidase F n=1 Tax=Litoribacterium kuwaitense TaxID=1398745 RepID=UPI0013EBD931|nr:oligoendopeptidase F [Litoribacterium kuwaitense]NGP44580.1 oligoendopeptidase F [Litoribacterium kuwaitense]